MLLDARARRESTLSFMDPLPIYRSKKKKRSARRGTSARITPNGSSDPQPFEGLCRFRNELIHEDGADLLEIHDSGHPRPLRVVSRLDFLFPRPQAERGSPPFFDWFAGGREREKERVGERRRKRDKEEERDRTKAKLVPRCPHSYSDCRFKCLLITRLVQQPPRSRSLYIFISTSRPSRFRE